MAATRTPGITQDARGDLILDKEYRGNRLFRRLGQLSLQDAESILQAEMARLAAELDLRMHARPLFRHCATRYLAESKQKRTVEAIAWHVRLLLAHFSDFHPERIHDGSLQPLIELRQSEGAGATTINRSLEVMRTILNRAARAYRDDDGRLGSSASRRRFQCFQNRLVRPVRLPGKNRTLSSNAFQDTFSG
jgi:hypothetical protein